MQVYGKFCEDKTKRREVHFVSTVEAYRKHLADPLFESCRPINEHCIQVNKYKPSCDLDRPIAVGASILEISKNIMFRYYYEELVPVLGDQNLEMLYTDTDSLIISFRTKDLNADLVRLSSKMDYSNFYPGHQRFSKENAAKLFHMKIELAAHKIIAAIFLKSKCYALLVDPDVNQIAYEKSKKIKHGFELCDKDAELIGTLLRCKGVKDAKNVLQWILYYFTLKDEKSHYASAVRFVSKSHVVHRVNVTKMAMNSFDDKRHIKNCGTCSTAYGSIFEDPHCGCFGLGC